MKKPVSIILSSLMLASALTACAPAQDKLDPAITLASSDAAAKATWLDERLDVIPDDVVLGIGSNTAYGIDMNGFENDGYIARAIGDEVLLFGATADGLDRAVRKYAKAAEDGQTANINEVYHEGYRIKKLTIAGTDISEYTVVYNYDRDVFNPSSSDARTYGNAKYAAEELVRLISVATGITIPTSAEDVEGPMVKIDYITDGSHGDNGFTYEVKDGNVYINGAPDANGCANGVYYFLEKECGWEDLTYGDSVLQAADHLDIPNGASDSVDPMFDAFITRYEYYERFVNERSAFSQGYVGAVSYAGHGMQSHGWAGISGSSVAKEQICHTSESNYLTAFDRVWTYVSNRVANGEIIGETLNFVDIAQGDNFYYCICSDCQKVFREENRAHSGAVVRFANRLAEDMEAENFGGLRYKIYAYWNSNKPCKTAPRDDVHVTFCTDRNCSAHPLDGSECFGISFAAGMMGAMPDMDPVNNCDYGEWIEGWSELTDNLFVWYYVLDNNIHAYTVLGNLYEDLNFMKECGVRGILVQMDYRGLGIARVQRMMVYKMQMDPDMTEAEYETVLREVLEKEYGEGWHYIREYINLWEDTQNRTGGCWNCWGYGDMYIRGYYDKGYYDGYFKFNTEVYAGYFDTMYGLFENAIFLADTAKQEKACELLSISMIYEGCFSEYFKCYDADDDDRIAVLSDRWNVMMERLREHGVITADGIVTGQDNTKHKVYDILDETAWIQWVEMREYLTPEGTTQKPMPDEWVEWYATSETETQA